MVKKKSNKMCILFYAGLVLFIISVILGISAYKLYGGEVTTHVDCYDRFGNKILNQVCEEEVMIMEEPGSFLGGLSFALLLISSIMIAWSVVKKNPFDDLEELD